MSNIDFKIKGIGELIKDHQFTIPAYQRPYAWKEKHINDLFSDIHNSINNSDNEYFLAPLFFLKKENPDKLEIVDGQQRITSIIIFLSTIKEYFEKHNKLKQAQSIQQNYLSTYIMRDDEERPKINLGNQDNTFFREFIIDNKDTQATKESHHRIKKTKSLSVEKVSKLAELSNDNLNILHDWIEFINNKLKIISITVTNESNAFTIFETLNDRGLELAQVDLLKNYLYSRAGDRLDEVKNLWDEMTSQIETAETENLILTYIKHHWSAQHGLTREKNKELYNNIKNKIRNPSHVVDFVVTLKNDTVLYLAIVNHNHQYWNNHNSQVKQYLKTLNFFGLWQFRPLLLAILKKFKNKKEIEKSLKLLVSWLARNLITGSLGGGSLEKTYSNKAKEVFDGNILDAKQLKDTLQALIPSDKEFKEKFVIAKSSKEKYARYYLKAIDNQMRGDSLPCLLVNSDPNAVNLEHILPKAPHGNWGNFSEKQADELKNRIGNLTLLPSKVNSEQGNASFKDKKKIFRTSEFEITKMITEYDDWNENNIRDRQEKLAKLAIKVWNLNLE